MSADVITGVLVLQRSKESGIFHLWFVYETKGTRNQSYIPAKDKSLDPTPHGTTWDFVRRNPWLDCSPSVRILGFQNEPDIFHNEGQWSCHYVEMAQSIYSEPSGRDVHEAINFPEKTKEEMDLIIGTYRLQGVLL